MLSNWLRMSSFVKKSSSIPLMREAYSAAASEPERLVYAHVLGMLGDRAGAKRKVLIDNPSRFL